MITVEKRDQETLHFWKLIQGEYILQTKTTIDPCFGVDVRGNICVTTHAKHFTTWKLDQEWSPTLKSTFKYQPNDVSISEDSSLIAVGFGSLVTLWHDGVLVKSFSISEEVKQLFFVDGTSNLLILGSSRTLLWSIASGSGILY